MALRLQIYPYVITDQAKIEGPSLGVLKPKSMQSSHNWEGIDNVPRVGAVPPKSIYLLGPNPADPNVANMFVGNLYCGRCHKVHGSVGGTDTSIEPPFLRVNNDQDQMCLDCHSPRNQTSQASGTHPIQMNYCSRDKSKRYVYYYPPVNA